MSLCHILESSNPKSLKPDGVNLYYFKLRVMWSARIQSLKIQRSMTFGCKDIGVRKSEFVAKTQFLYRMTVFLSKVA